MSQAGHPLDLARKPAAPVHSRISEMSVRPEFDCFIPYSLLMSYLSLTKCFALGLKDALLLPPRS
jgi:ATP/ADP translocase